MSRITISAAQPAELEIVKALLERAHLPSVGLLEHFDHALLARDGNRIVGCAALEVYGDTALLRSVAVDAGHRRDGIGTDLTQAALQLANDRNVSAVYLLTETAERFFARFDFETIDRADVPASVLRSVEFVHACCASASVMRKFLTLAT